MNIIDAIKSGKRFRRITWMPHGWGGCKPGRWLKVDGLQFTFETGDVYALDIQDVQGHDWEIEIEEKPMRIWRNQDSGALKFCDEKPTSEMTMNGDWQSETSGLVTARYSEWTDVTESFKKALGL